MKASTISQDEVLTREKQLPAFPSVVGKILDAIDDVDANLNLLIELIAKDPVMTSQVISRANRIAPFGRTNRSISELKVATALIGTVTIRHIALIGGFFQFSGATLKDHTVFTNHCISTALCSEELSKHLNINISMEAALITGLLHDIGKLWILRFRSNEYIDLKIKKREGSSSSHQLEMDYFGVDHAQVGYWLAEHWKLPHTICSAIRHHHHPERDSTETLVSLTHVSDVLSHALEINLEADNRVKYLSSSACVAIGLEWNADIRPLFGRIDARNRYSRTFFDMTHEA